MHRTTVPKLEDVFRAILRIPQGVDVTTLSQGDVPEWDSLAHVSLILALEGEFGVEIDAVDAADLTSFDATAQYLEGHGL